MQALRPLALARALAAAPAARPGVPAPVKRPPAPGGDSLGPMRATWRPRKGGLDSAPAGG